MPTVGARRHAEKVAEWGVDAVIAQGAEGGGHTGTVPTSLLLPQVCDAVDIPVIAAGGFFDGRGLVAALAYGAAGIAMGTRFLLSAESRVPDAVKARYLEPRSPTPSSPSRSTAIRSGDPHRARRSPDRAAKLGAAGRYHHLHHVVTNLGVLDFETTDHRMRLHSVHPGVTVDEIVAATGFELVVPSDVPETRAPTPDELSLIREVIDPHGLREQEVPNP